MKWLLLMIILVSCGKKVVEESNFPQNQASEVEREILDDALTTIQANFDALGVRIDVRDTRYSVADTSNALGICFKNADGERTGIALHHKLFADVIESEEVYGLLYKVLLHEIGHCFFDRDHEETYYQAPGHAMLIEMSPGVIERHISIPVTLMSEIGWYRVPKILWPYYVKEIAGIDRIVSWETLEAYTSIRLEEMLASPETAETEN